jgi:hypothetical protein
MKANYTAISKLKDEVLQKNRQHDSSIQRSLSLSVLDSHEAKKHLGNVDFLNDFNMDPTYYDFDILGHPITSEFDESHSPVKIQVPEAIVNINRGIVNKNYVSLTPLERSMNSSPTQPFSGNPFSASSSLNTAQMEYFSNHPSNSPDIGYFDIFSPKRPYHEKTPKTPYDRKKYHMETERKYRQDISTRLRVLHFLVPETNSNFQFFNGLKNLPNNMRISRDDVIVEAPNEYKSKTKVGGVPNKLKILQRTVTYVKWLRALNRDETASNNNILGIN